MAITHNDLWNQMIPCKLGPNSRMFFGSPDYDYRSTLKLLHKIPGLTLLSCEIEPPSSRSSDSRNSSSIWEIHFLYCDLEFLIETNHHGTATTFFVSSGECPDETLLSILEHFEQLGPLKWPDED